MATFPKLVLNATLATPNTLSANMNFPRLQAGESALPETVFLFPTFGENESYFHFAGSYTAEREALITPHLSPANFWSTIPPQACLRFSGSALFAPQGVSYDPQGELMYWQNTRLGFSGHATMSADVSYIASPFYQGSEWRPSLNLCLPGWWEPWYNYNTGESGAVWHPIWYTSFWFASTELASVARLKLSGSSDVEWWPAPEIHDVLTLTGYARGDCLPEVYATLPLRCKARGDCLPEVNATLRLRCAASGNTGDIAQARGRLVCSARAVGGVYGARCSVTLKARSVGYTGALAKAGGVMALQSRVTALAGESGEASATLVLQGKANSLMPGVGAVVSRAVGRIGGRATGIAGESGATAIRLSLLSRSRGSTHEAGWMPSAARLLLCAMASGGVLETPVRRMVSLNLKTGAVGEYDLDAASVVIFNGGVYLALADGIYRMEPQQSGILAELETGDLVGKSESLKRLTEAYCFGELTESGCTLSITTEQGDRYEYEAQITASGVAKSHLGRGLKARRYRASVRLPDAASGEVIRGAEVVEVETGRVW